VGVVFGSNEVTTGGTALRFYASVRLEIRRAGQLKNEGEPHGSRIKVKVVKNKLAPPFGVVRPFPFSFPIISVGGTGLCYHHAQRSALFRPRNLSRV
jgi:RecA/RadA recombinase